MPTSHKESSRLLFNKTSQVFWWKRWFFNKLCKARDNTITIVYNNSWTEAAQLPGSSSHPSLLPDSSTRPSHSLMPTAALDIRHHFPWCLSLQEAAAHHSSEPRAGRMHSPAEAVTAQLLCPQQPLSHTAREEPQPPLTFTSGTIPFSLVAAASYSGASRLQCPHLRAGGKGGASGPPERLGTARPAPTFAPGPARPRAAPRAPQARLCPAASHQGAKNSTSTSPGRSARPLSKSASLSSTTSEAPAERARSGTSSSSAARDGRGTDMASDRAELRSLFGDGGG